jgi:hypothetical protein
MTYRILSRELNLIALGPLRSSKTIRLPTSCFDKAQRHRQQAHVYLSNTLLTCHNCVHHQYRIALKRVFLEGLIYFAPESFLRLQRADDNAANMRLYPGLMTSCSLRSNIFARSASLCTVCFSLASTYTITPYSSRQQRWASTASDHSKTKSEDGRSSASLAAKIPSKGWSVTLSKFDPRVFLGASDISDFRDSRFTPLALLMYEFVSFSHLVA